jgi:hypothetical protein
MSREFVGVSESDDIESVLEVMVHEPVTSVVVLRGSTPVGMVHALDVLERIADQEGLAGVTVDEVMRAPPEPVGAEQDVETALDRLSTGWDRQLPVTDVDDQLVGVVSESDVLAAAAALFSTGERTEPRQEPLEVETAGGTVSGRSTSRRADDAYANHESDSTPSSADTSGTQTDTGLTQGVCESCGSLVDDLGGHNGQLLCRECRDI